MVHVLCEPPADWEGETGFVSQPLLEKILPVAAHSYEYFMCGPKPMSESVQLGLRTLRVPLAKIHLELFDMV